LFDKFGEGDVVDFVNKFTQKDINKEEKRYMGTMADSELQEINIHREVNLPSCSVTVEGVDIFEIRDTASAAMMEKIDKDAIWLRTLVAELGKRVDIDVSTFFVHEYRLLLELPPERESELATVFAGSGTLTNFLKIATKLAKTTDDFALIGAINSCKNQILDYKKAQSFVCDLVDSSIRRRSVVSFYVNEDVWRFLPLAIRGKDWITIVNTYLSSIRK
jgi:hypothetical protein